MIIVRTEIRAVFDEVASKQDIKDKLTDAVSNAEWKSLLDSFNAAGKIKRRMKKWEQDEFDNWVYTSVLAYDDFETYHECFTCPAGEEILRKLYAAGFELNVKIKEYSNSLASVI